MSRQDRQRLEDILAAIETIGSHLARGPLTDALVFDAVRVRLIEIGEAVKTLPADVLAAAPNIPWAQIAGMRDYLAHRYFDISPAILTATVKQDLPELERATRELLATVREDPPTPSVALASAACVTVSNLAPRLWRTRQSKGQAATTRRASYFQSL